MSDDLEHQLDEQSRRMRREVRAECIAAGRPEVADQFDQRMRDIDLGITSARNCWHSISGAQRSALIFAARQNGLHRHSIKPNRYWGISGTAPSAAIRVTTVRSLLAHDLMSCDGGAFDPEKIVIVTERGRFVLKHGSLHSCPTCRR